MSWAELRGREWADPARGMSAALGALAWGDLGALAYGDLAAGKLAADAAPGRTATDVKAAVHVTVKMARCRVRATVMAVSPLVVAQARAMPGPEPRD